MSALIQSSSVSVGKASFGASLKRVDFFATRFIAAPRNSCITGSVRRSFLAEVSVCCRPSSDISFFPSSHRTRCFSISSSLDERKNTTAQDISKGREEGDSKVQRRVPVLGTSGNVRRSRTLEVQQQPKDEPLSGVSKDNKRTYDSDLVVVLDMDECLIHSVFQSATQDLEQFRQFERERAHRGQGDKSYKKWSRTTPSLEETTGSSSESLYDDTFDIDMTVEKFQITLPDGEGVLVHQRPHLPSFLAEVCQKFETHIFTAAMPVYASPVLDVLEDRARAVQSSETARSNGSIFSQRWYRDQCTVHRDLGVYVKDLEHVLTNNPPTHLVGNNIDRATLFNEKRTVLIDNNPMSFLANPCNGILVSNFYDDPSDDTLPAVVELLHELDGYDDVRPKLRELFGLQDALNQVLSKKGFTYKSKKKPFNDLTLSSTNEDLCATQQDQTI